MHFGIREVKRRQYLHTRILYLHEYNKKIFTPQRSKVAKLSLHVKVYMLKVAQVAVNSLIFNVLLNYYTVNWHDHATHNLIWPAIL